MSVEIPEIVEILHAARDAYTCGRANWDNHRLTKRPDCGLCPKRKGPTSRVIAKIMKETDLPGKYINQARAILLAAFDLGIRHEYEERENDREQDPR